MIQHMVHQRSCQSIEVNCGDVVNTPESTFPLDIGAVRTAGAACTGAVGATSDAVNASMVSVKITMRVVCRVRHPVSRMSMQFKLQSVDNT